MLFSHFTARVVIRVIVLGLLMAACIYTLQMDGMLLSSSILGILVIVAVFELIRFVTYTNRKLTRFFESVKYSDFLSGFTVDDRLGKSFKDLNTAFSDVLDAFRKARSEKEEHWQYLNTVIQHVSTGLLSYDSKGEVQLINTVAKGFLGAPQMRNIDEIKSLETLYRILVRIQPGDKRLCRLNDKVNLVIHATNLRMHGNMFTLVALQNIQTELQQQEIESWQNLTRVLRHEIMNSMTPIASLTSTLNDILTEELEQKGDHFEISIDGVDDIHDGIKTIESRSQALINFIDAYREYTTIPQPNVAPFKVKDLFEEVTALLKVEIRKAKVRLVTEVHPESFEITGDSELLEQVLINLLKNAVESVQGGEKALVKVTSGLDSSNNPFISVEDNGPGIVPEALERIFIPFYTTKQMGSGIGLALSRQIMQLHQGTLSAESKAQEYTRFTMRF